ncbi:hypothetical protein O181_126009 [Austropuccinia psidii MF-1]|uniref:Uncharacterized protein n=1 Tax=Austropuccinia psidii MF-1 TaxID=1389203 RepID=A0A9Q3Q5T2_9BASI|nr:hypothetical protein [Austropuccinia psidii MF-1]
MASSGYFDSSQTYDGYKAVKALAFACTKFLKKGKQFFHTYNPLSSKCHPCFVGKKPCQHPGAPISNVRKYLWSRKNVPFGRDFPVSEAPTPDSNLGYSNLTGSRERYVAKWTNAEGPIPIGGRPSYSSSEFPISRINSQGLVKRLRRISNSPTDPNSEGSSELDDEESEVVPNSFGHQCSTSASQPASRRFQSQVIHSTHRSLQPVLSTICPPSPNPSAARPALVSAVRPSPI